MQFSPLHRLVVVSFLPYKIVIIPVCPFGVDSQPNLPFYLPILLVYSPSAIKHVGVMLNPSLTYPSINASMNHWYVSTSSLVELNFLANKNALSHKTNSKQKCVHNASIFSPCSSQLYLFSTFRIEANFSKMKGCIVHYLFHIFPI